MPKYINIEKNGDNGLHFDALCSNLGYCLSATTDDDFDDFHQNVYQIGVDFLYILQKDFPEIKMLSMLTKSFEKSETMGCGCTENKYGINHCHIMYLVSMIHHIEKFKEKHTECINCFFEFLNKRYRIFLVEQSLVDFYSYYFTILRGSFFTIASKRHLLNFYYTDVALDKEK